jgi:5-oxoprolinase (ATP-hydrolysing) subunit A
MNIDLNCDMGEGCENDAELMAFVSSVNIACGYHAGDGETMRRTADLAVKNGLAIGAHPSYRDRDNFGRSDMDLPPDEIYQIVTEQIGVLSEIVIAAGGKLAHVKPHGALYNRSARDITVAKAIAAAVRDFDSSLILFGLAGSVSLQEAEKLGLGCASESFMDRTYQADGSLTPRTQPNALIASSEIAAVQAASMIFEKVVISTDGSPVPLEVDTICIHGDSPNAVDFAKAVREELNRRGIVVKAVTK